MMNERRRAVLGICSEYRQNRFEYFLNLQELCLADVALCQR